MIAKSPLGHSVEIEFEKLLHTFDVTEESLNRYASAVINSTTNILELGDIGRQILSLARDCLMKTQVFSQIVLHDNIFDLKQRISRFENSIVSLTNDIAHYTTDKKQLPSSFNKTFNELRLSIVIATGNEIHVYECEFMKILAEYNNLNTKKSDVIADQRAPSPKLFGSNAK